MPNPLPGTLFTVTASMLNRDNPFWSRLIGKRATLSKVEADGLWSMIVDDGGYASPVDGVRPERLALAPAGTPPMVLLDADVPMATPAEPRKVWWKRLFTWLGE
jgi:hypothetical protein